MPTDAVGNPDLVEESVDAFEVAYTGNIRNRASVSAAWYYTKFEEQIFFTTTGVWLTPPPGFPGLGPIPPSFVWQGLINQGIVFPSDFSYRNLGQVKSQGIELGLDGVADGLDQRLRELLVSGLNPIRISRADGGAGAPEINIPARHLFNAGVSCVTPRTFALLSINHSSEAFWQDVLDARFHGTTEATRW